MEPGYFISGTWLLQLNLPADPAPLLVELIIDAVLADIQSVCAVLHSS